MKVQDQVKVLKKRFDAPSKFRLLCHKIRNDEVAGCCQAAKTSIRGAVVESAANGGIVGVIEYFTSQFSWGCLQSKYYCDCLTNKDDLYCIGTTCVGLECLSFYKSISEHKIFDLMVVEFLVSDCASVIRTEKQYLTEASNMTSAAERSHSWVLTDVFYHVLVGLVDQQYNLMVCDSDGSMPFLATNNGSAARIQSMRVSPWEGDINPVRSMSHVNWNGTEIVLNRWVDEVNIDRGDTTATAVETLGKVYGVNHGLSTTTLDAHNAAFSLTNFTRKRCTNATGVITTVLISGTYMGSNPCPGVGIARALRTALGADGVRLVSVGDAEFSDPVFDTHWPVLELGAAAYLSGPTKTQTQWDIVAELILTQAETSELPVFFVPGCDSDIELMAEGKAALQRMLLESNSPQRCEAIDVNDNRDLAKLVHTDAVLISTDWSIVQAKTLHNAILCPEVAVVALTAKPSIVAASSGPLGAFFKVPEYFLLNTGSAAEESVSLLEMRMFADRIGYPVLIKGSKQGALVCHSWLQLRAVITTQAWVKQGGAFIQKCKRGWERCIAFAAFKGRLLGCCLMTKASYTEKGKVWSGDIEAVPSDLCVALQAFVLQNYWTGGGEIEFIEEIVPRGVMCFDGKSVGPNTMQTMFLPRSSVPTRSAYNPAIVLSSDHESSSVPIRWVVDFNPRFPAWIFASAYSECNLPALLIEAAVQAHLASESQTQASRSSSDTASTTSTSTSGGSPSSSAFPMVEVRVPHSVSFVRSLIEVPVVHTLHRRHLPSCVGNQLGKGSKSKEDTLLCEQLSTYNVLPHSCRQVLGGDYSLRTYVTDESLRFLTNDLRRLTTATKSLLPADAIGCTPRYIFCTLTLENTLQRMQKLIEEVAAPSQLPVQLCLSVKTQPHTALIRLAAQAGFFAECIDLAEVYHAVLNGGFSFEQVVLTGPAKWWDVKSTEERGADLAEWEHTQARCTTRKLHAIFADSLSDLQDIVERLLDPNSSTIDTDVVGIRWAPLGSIRSRFGLDSNDVKVVRRAAELVRQLLTKYRLGMHFHYASSVLGGERWFGFAQAFCVFSGEFAQLCGRPIATIDFGGGFEPYFLESQYAQEKLGDLFQTVHHTCGQTRSPSPITVQFELGKCISEPAGAVLTRILAIRERTSSQEEEDDVLLGAARAVVVDSTVADLSTRSTRPVFWVKRTTSCSNNACTIECIALAGGSTEIWGRTCMEWDKVFGSFALPAEVKVGDFLLIAGCGAYDMSMQYNFGDAFVRTENVIVL